MSLLCIDVQNSQTMVGIFDHETLVAHWRVSTDDQRTRDEWAILMAGLMDQASVSARVAGVCICSAVPAVLAELRCMVAAHFPSAHSVVVGPGVRSGLPLLTDNPREVGTDRIANAVAALEMFGAPCIVVDVGMATTFDVVGADGQYRGGAIAPGVQISLEALGLRGAQLRQVELTAPRTVIAKNTVEALQAGAVFGFAGQVDGIVARMRRALGAEADHLEVVATGGLAASVIAHCESITQHQPWLGLHGLAAIFARNPESR